MNLMPNTRTVKLNINKRDRSYYDYALGRERMAQRDSLDINIRMRINNIERR